MIFFVFKGKTTSFIFGLDFKLNIILQIFFQLDQLTFEENHITFTTYQD